MRGYSHSRKLRLIWSRAHERGKMMIVERKKLGLGMIIFAVALAMASFFLIDRYDDKKGFVSNVTEARFTIWKDCKKPEDKRVEKLGGVTSESAWIERHTLQCDTVQLPYRWVLVVALGLFFTGLFVELSRARRPATF
jgi:hypothetical protein